MIPNPIQASAAIHRDGVARCARYAFGPNKLHLCGPDANAEVLAYMKEGIVDPGLEKLLSQFSTLYPYLVHIAHANNIRDPFDERVVHAYWIGNELLETISVKSFFSHLADSLNLKRRYAKKEFDQLAQKLPQGARMHHSFHVLNAYKRTGNDVRFHNLETMDACRISWGRVVSLDGPRITLKRKPLVLNGYHIALDSEQTFAVTRQLQDDIEFDDLAAGDIISLHWGRPCEIITPQDARLLEHYTKKHIALSNLTL